jgi:hypothetical protein
MDNRESENQPVQVASGLYDGLGDWLPYPAFHPAPMDEVLVWIDGHRGPSWRNNHALVAYIDRTGFWWEERHPSKEPLGGVILWKPIRIPDVT